MKIALVTIHEANNYGAIFQTYATQIVLSMFGDVEIVNYKNRHISRSFDLIRFNLSFRGLLWAGRDVMRILPRKRVINKFKKFIDRNFKLTKVYSQKDILNNLLPKYDVYIAGSDQIWNPACISKNCTLDPVYFLDFVPENSRKISYSSSIGGYNYSESEKKQVKNFLQKYEAISVREKSTQTLLHKLMGKHIVHVLDPTLLLSKEEWLCVGNLHEGSKPNQKYILLFTVPKLPLIKQVVEFFSKKLGLNVISIEQGLTPGAKVDLHIRDAGPEEFLKLFAEAEFVITDSFHGTCFAINFCKPFVAVSSGKHINRIESLLNVVGLENKLILEKSSLYDFDINIDYDAVHEKLFRSRDESLNFLKKLLIN
ncbi:MAG: polysaccharide pyruvyl transferase family protein [Desulfuromonadaceae bacterium]|nr:polysaccharide pyruvyl transferase family protein [Desulfuromonadaceae bacterium]